MSKARIPVLREERHLKASERNRPAEPAPPIQRGPSVFPEPAPLFPPIPNDPEMQRLRAGATPGEVSSSGPLAECARVAGLSPRELEIVRLVAKGCVNKTVADVLDISQWTVAAHLRRIFAKLSVTSRAAMVARVFEIGNAAQAPRSKAARTLSA